MILRRQTVSAADTPWSDVNVEDLDHAVLEIDAADHAEGALSSAPYTEHRGRFLLNPHSRRVRPQNLHCPRMFTACRRSNIATIAKSRTASSLTTSGSTCSSLPSLSTHCSNCSQSNRYRTSYTAVAVSSQAPR
jgi:hypothetical protein